jgi:large subunit ribosomal protein L1
MPKHGKKFNNAVKDVDLTVRYTVDEGVGLVEKTSFAKFDETVDVALNLGVDPKYSDQMVRGAVSLPNGLGKTVRVAAFCRGDKEANGRGRRRLWGRGTRWPRTRRWLASTRAVARDMMAGRQTAASGTRWSLPNAKNGNRDPTSARL